MKIRVGILMGGISREREVSFAGGRTIFDNLDRSLFEPIPVFIDSTGVPLILEWKYLYKGSIRDFLPDPSIWIPSPVPVYIESLPDTDKPKARENVGKPISWDDLQDLIDVALLILHGPWGEDGAIQGLLTSLGIPYTGSGIYPSSVCLSKWKVRELLEKEGFEVQPALRISIDTLLKEGFETVYSKVFGWANNQNIKSIVFRPENQGSSIGVSKAQIENKQAVYRSLLNALFIEPLTTQEWKKLQENIVPWLHKITDPRTGPAFPITILIVESGRVIHAHSIVRSPAELLQTLHSLKDWKEIWLWGYPRESYVIIEPEIQGEEFSCIVIEDPKTGNPVSLTPTHILKPAGTIFSYRAKYLPGIARKQTPAQFPPDIIKKIQEKATAAYQILNCNVYARIDGFVTRDGRVLITDPNTTSGMLPSSLLFHQAAIAGLSPGDFLTYVIQRSVDVRLKEPTATPSWYNINQQLRNIRIKARNIQKQKIAVIFGGVSTERHISVESGRNAFEKLTASTKYEPEPLFLDVEDGNPVIYKLPLWLLFKDNADDIRDLIRSENPLGTAHDAVRKLHAKLAHLILEEHSANKIPEKVSWQYLSKHYSCAFLALHGRPGEDGTLQSLLDRHGITYTGSGPETCRLGMDKYNTARFLQKHGFKTPRHMLVSKNDYLWQREKILDFIASIGGFPIIAKPVDEGCSNAVLKIRNTEQLDAYARAILGLSDNIHSEFSKAGLNISTELFPTGKTAFLIEEEVKPASHHEKVLEITVGVITETIDHTINYRAMTPSVVVREKDILTLEEKFLIGEGQNITPPVFTGNKKIDSALVNHIKKLIEKASRLFGIHGYARWDGFVRYKTRDPVNTIEVIFLEVNILPGITPGTVLFHQCAHEGMTPLDFFEHVIEEAFKIDIKPAPVQNVTEDL